MKTRLTPTRLLRKSLLSAVLLGAAFAPAMYAAVPLESGTSADQAAVRSTEQAAAALRTVSCSSVSCLQNALKNALPGDRILLAPGTYKGTFSSAVNGTKSNPVTIESQDPANQALISGTSAGGGYCLKITGDNWVIRNLKFTNAQKGIILDNSNDTLITGVEVYGIGYEGVHFRDGSSRGILENSYIHDTGTVNKGFGEGVYVGSAEGAGYNQAVNDTIIRGVRIGPNVTAEHIDIKERTSGTLVENCIFNGTGISGENYADSFIDVKGNNAVIRNNTGWRNGNTVITDAFQLHQIVAGWGVNNDFSGNTVNLDQSSAYVINASQGTQAKAHDNVRNPAGNMYTGNVTTY
ncbi:right-handed parallel beta-helix repeat-containing protein [Paenibacillus chitinolyticus]|uniref:right-handed parallel beta-helix repeat-containing protein n=1 Tax=Paenibacillus chitinolyticus TaxID=79263 RepID=UPI002DB55BA1|nr:right-handed parallel beta-helix repeat-containing protein [Paenibacillus chitinolyticus]MEC0246308.1 right-handed parallel beta-helix repeat-containing protein [Paenibacillus chitinolyticus]